MKIYLIFYIILLFIIIGIVIWGSVTNWRFIRRKGKDGYEGKQYIPFTIKLKKYMKSPKMHSDKWVKYVDKVLFKDYAKSKGVDTAKILLGPFDDAKEMKLKDIPENCVLKTNNGSGRNIGIKNGKIIFDGLDRPNEHFKGKLVKDVWNNIKKQLNDWRRSFNPGGGEPWYAHIKPKIFVEELLDPVPPDIRFWTFNGKVSAIHITQNARMGLEHCQTYYDRNGNEIDCKLNYPKCKNQEKPENFDEMVKVAESLAKGLEFARVDLYNYNGKILGGEITFAPMGGSVEFKPKSCDIIFSNFWN